MARSRTLLRETYKAGTKLHSGPHPEMPWMRRGKVFQVDLLARGIVEKDGQRQDYVDVRMWGLPLQNLLEEVLSPPSTEAERERAKPVSE